jgi:hypothetical protein
VTVQHHPRPRLRAAPLAEQAAQPIVAQLARPLERLAHDASNLVFGSRRTGGQGEALQ